ncbi:hypothetical protein GQ44DRAFT_737502 [Phaeosphaeriaceae sp. PMI808]|nr:hypothetical protein GQ44DRAFT_737502 [Phaeosphaeriaceae sp. PMI808]
MDSTFDLPDSTDWLSTSLPAFESLEAALRCEVCKEFLSNPVITSCSHTFCSICIRRCIATDGKCPSCKSACSSDKLAPNIAIREVVMRFQEARPTALEMARADKEEKLQIGSGKKRKLEDTDIEDTEPTRQTRSRQTRSNGHDNNGTGDTPIEIPDSEDDGDDDFVPDGMVKCPICNQAMKAETVYNHLDICPGQSSSQGRSTRLRRQKEPSPPPTRQSQFNYTMLNGNALKKKLQEIGIPTWGTKDLMKRRHIEWLNIFNSNCDAHESVRKSKRQLIKELEDWENTQGGRADSRESKIMKKDFDGNDYAKSNKTQFDDLIAKARQKRAPKTPEGSESKPPEDNVCPTPPPQHPPPVQSHPPAHPSHLAASHPTTQNPYEDNTAALSTIQAKVALVNETGSTLPNISPAPPTHHDTTSSSPVLGIENPLGGSERKVTMFALPEQPVHDVDSSGAVQ